MRHIQICVILSLLLLGGCIVGDELTTLTIHPDGSAELVVLRSNLRSTQTGEEAQRELAQYKTSFDSRDADPFDRIRQSGGEVIDAAWIRDQAPYSNYLRARFPTSQTLEKFYSSSDGDFQVTTQLRSDDAGRRLVVRIEVAPGKTNPFTPSSRDIDQLRQRYADGLSETRIAITHGSITSARGFTIASDKQSALLDVIQLEELMQAGKGKAEIYLQWK